MEYYESMISSICSGKTKPSDIKVFLDKLLDLICEVGINRNVGDILCTIKKNRYMFFRYSDTKNHVIKEFLR